MSMLGLGDYGSDEEEEEAEEEREEGQAHERLGEDDAAAAASGAVFQNGVAAGANLFSAAPDISLTPPQSIVLGAEHGGRPGDPEDQQGAGGNSAPGPDESNNVWSQLPPELRAAPPGSCSPAVEAKLLNIIATSRRQQRSFIDSLRKHRQYSNPDLLQQLVKIYNLKEAGSSFPPDVFNLDVLPKEDSSDQLLRQLERLQETRRQQRAEAKPGQATIPFERGTGSLGTLPPTSSSAGTAKGAAAPSTSSMVKAAALAAQQAAAAAAAAAGSAPGSGLLNVIQLREQAERNAAAMMANASKRSKWDSAK